VIDGRRLRRLLVCVALLSGGLVVVSRWAGRAVPPDVATQAAPGAAPGPARGADRPGVEADALGDLTFFQGLGKPRASAPEAAPGMPRNTGARDATAPAASAWVVQAMATTDGPSARRLRDRLGRAGLPATIVEDRQAQRVAYRVRVGRYRDRSVAEVMAKKLRDEFGLTPWILPDGD